VAETKTTSNNYLFEEAVMNEKQMHFVKLVFFLVLAIALTSCAELPSQSGFLNGHYKDMQPGPEGGVKMRWIKPGVDFSRYNKVMLDSVVFSFADDSEYKGIDPEQLKELSDACNLAIVNALKDKYPIVSEPGPDVVRLKIALTGIKQSRPVFSGVTSIVPIGLGISVIKKGAAGSWTGSGATNAELLIIDPTTNTVIGAAQDERTAGFTERFTKYGSAEEAFKFWAERIRTFMDQAHGIQ
jgi:hypothetical protein